MSAATEGATNTLGEAPVSGDAQAQGQGQASSGVEAQPTTIMQDEGGAGASKATSSTNATSAANTSSALSTTNAASTTNETSETHATYAAYMASASKAMATERAAQRRARREARKVAKMQAKGACPKIRKWRGLLADEELPRRLAVFAVIVLVMASLTFTQLGFLGVGLPGRYVAYCMTLLAPVALAALLFGIPLGTLAGLVAGSVLYAHALFQPLDYYEVNFISPFSSVLLFTFVGFTLSFFFAVALRRNPSRARRIVYISIVCLVVSASFSAIFSTYAVLKLVFTYVAVALDAGVSPDSADILSYVLPLFVQMGSLKIQVLFDALIMIAVCCLAFPVVERVRASRTGSSLRTLFRVWLFVAVFIALMITAATSFVVITEQAKAQAKESMTGEVDYLITQLKDSTSHQESLAKFIEKDGASEKSLSESEAHDLNALVSLENLLDGYTVEADGTVVIFKDNKVILSDDENFQVGDTWDDCFDGSDISFRELIDTDDMVQVAYGVDENDDLSELEHEFSSREDVDELFDRRITTQMSFMVVTEWEGYDIMVMEADTKVFAERTSVMAWSSLSTFILLLAVYLVAARMLGQLVVRRIDETNGVLADITDGNLDARVTIHDSREFESLSTGINTTVAALKHSISEAESRMDQELATAKAIQESALPRIFPPFPDVHRFDIYASMKPAREVGGDFYDFFLIGDDSGAREGKLGFVVADVSGKGVPAALFMMAAKTEVRNYLESGIDPGEAVENANRQLCDGNDAGMFVTVFAGVLDYGTGHVQFVNAGHNPPLLWQKGKWRWLRDVSGMPLGLFDGFPYETYEVDLQIGDEFLIYTDGVTEAMNKAGELYGEECLEDLVNANFTLHPRDLIRVVSRNLVRYARGAVQSDDITMLALEYGVPPELTARLIVKASVEELPRVNEFIHTELDRRLCPVKVQKQLDIALEELFVNVAHYAYPDATPEEPGRVAVSYTYSADPPSVRVEIIDKGVPYNPLEKPDAVTPDDIMEVPIGGLGILMAKNSVDEMTYEFRDGSNVVAFVKKW